jgi:hypothetical protein
LPLAHTSLAFTSFPQYASGMIEAAEIEQMTVAERLQVMELLWASLSRVPDSVPSPDWHGQVLSERLARIERGEAEFLTIQQLKVRLQKPPA